MRDAAGITGAAIIIKVGGSAATGVNVAAGATVVTAGATDNYPLMGA